MAGSDIENIITLVVNSVPEEYFGSSCNREELTRLLDGSEPLNEYLTRLLQEVDAELSKANNTLSAAKNKEDFYRKSLLVLNRIITSPPPRVAAELASFNRLLLEGAGMEELEIGLQAIATTLLMEEAESLPLPQSELTAPSQVHDAPIPSTSEGIQAELLDKTRLIYLNLLDALRIDLDDDYTGTVRTLFEKVMACTDMTTLLGLGPEVEFIVRRFSREVFDRRREAQAFATEVLSNLAELNTFLKVTLTHNTEQSKSDSAFNDVLDNQLDSLQKSVRQTNTLGDLKNLVVEGLKTVKSTVADKRKADEARLQETQEQLTGMRKEFGKLAKKVASVQKENKALARKVQFDPLTGIHNRYAFTTRLEYEHSRMSNDCAPACIVIADIDHFKVINDTYGHLVGDKVLVEVARRLKSTLRESDFLARYGGEEFVVILPETALGHAMNLAERLRLRIEATDFMVRKKVLDITISCGVAEIKVEDPSPYEALDRADKFLYEAKRTGRNKVCGMERDLDDITPR